MTHSFQDDRKQTCGAGLSITRSGIFYPSTDGHALLNAAVWATGYADAVPDLERTETWRVLQVRMGISRILS